MRTNGIKILDGEGDALSTTLSDILEEFSDGKSFYWSILFLDGMPHREHGRFLMKYAKKINHSENGIPIKWEELIALSEKFFQMYVILVLGCKDVRLLQRYDKEKEMYEACDVVIELIDCAFWEVYSKDEDFIDRLKNKFKEIEILSPIDADTQI